MDHQQKDAGTTAERIAEALRMRIVRGEIAGGAALRQDHVAEEFQSSHVPVREAFQRLEAQGLVVTLPRRGVRVTSLNPAVIKENVEMRAALEILALRHSAPKFTPEHIERLEQAHAACSEAASLAQWDAANNLFHEILSSECGMPRLLAVLRQLQLTNSRYLFSTGFKRGWQPRSDHDHMLIIDALKEKKVDRALQLLSMHIGTMERVGFSAA
ncbi:MULTISPECIES: GntR family transcriptional regulator [unclassified Herbaspirillum]|uniref:GntR family transcriptional regulator n=1 Tax=unclassified Herbaspirillum TaxID=2624150 RepID=UPI00114EAB07|nr:MULTISPECIES: GntR family transcriptional regulator [unclassified Herbaspirillum]MBB5393266.1 DNA-binding GntR family transcriptional regulator [Herbaspirillum sp. SJZ102]TQK03985.1 GntR family transcriptional regulator [Herbaspirillum sp. SJZ130]TQK08717.1 GntR family transcriptional regulator [Herbaspirillum sp. SJZ106]TWC71988.1 GntR family transcriptional regulator [Herbaspirillum sp. SJZ099]